MTTCLNCEQPPEPGRIFCSIHSDQSAPPQRSASRVFLTSMIVTLMLGAIIFGCYMGIRLVQR